MKREFRIRYNRENKNLVNSVVNAYSQTSLMKGNVRVNDDNYDYTEIQFKCSRRKLKDCRLVLREMLNAGLLSETVEIW